jgi:hypothetical protein
MGEYRSERRPVPGLEDVLEVDRYCNLYHLGEAQKIEMTWPEARVEINGQTIGVIAPEATALAFLDDRERIALAVADELLLVRGPKDRVLRKKAADLGISPWALWEVLRDDKDGFTLPKRIEAAKSGSKNTQLTTHLEEGVVEDSLFDAYPRPRLIEHHRPPSRGGNTGALHRHTIVVEGVPYTFVAVGARQWAFAEDRLSFRYTVEPNGYRNIIKSSFRTVDKAGTPVVRGNREFKQQLRTAPIRLPVSHREQNG